MADSTSGNMLTRRYDFRLYPNAAQLAAIEDQAVLLTRLWNAALEQRETQWRLLLQREGECRRGLYRELIRREARLVTVAHDRRVVPADRRKELRGLSYYDQARELKHLRAAFPEYAAMSCASLELCLAALDLAFKAFWRRVKEGAGGAAGYPRYKSAALASTIWHRDGSGWKMRPHGKHWKFYFRGVPGEVKARGRFPQHPDEIRTMEIVKRPDGWFASVVVRLTPRQMRGQLLKGLVEMDEAYVGGKPRKKNRRDDDDHAPRGRATKKTPVVGAVERGGRMKAKAVDKSEMTAEDMKALVIAMIDTKESVLTTDEYSGYNGLNNIVAHRRINHSVSYVERDLFSSQYGPIHTNTIESVWAILKRAVMGQFHHVSRKYLPLYLNEIVYRYNARMKCDAFDGLLHLAVKP